MENIEKLLEELSILNVSMFIVWNIGSWTGKPILEWISLVGICVSIIGVLAVLYKIKKASDEKCESYYKRVINQLVFDVFFVLAFFFTLPPSFL